MRSLITWADKACLKAFEDQTTPAFDFSSVVQQDGWDKLLPPIRPSWEILIECGMIWCASAIIRVRASSWPALNFLWVFSGCFIAWDPVML